MSLISKPTVAVLLPCYNEEQAIAKVVRDFRAALPDATIYVYDNNSKDNTAAVARAAGAIARTEMQQGKGHVVRRMFRDIEADFYLMADGDDTYEASIAPEMVRIASEQNIDLINCIRREVEQEAYRGGHRFGNLLLTGAVRSIFGNRVRDMLSGYKIFSRRYVKSFPALAQGFDIETELTVHALELSLPVEHVEGPYRGRPEGSESKLRTYRDGWRILMLIIKLLRHERPVAFFGIIAAVLLLASVVSVAPVLGTYVETGLVPRIPTLIMSVAFLSMAFLSVVTGTILDTVSRGRRELRLLAYLQYPAFQSIERGTAPASPVQSTERETLPAIR